jgi:hypothetical protein
MDGIMHLLIVGAIIAFVLLLIMGAREGLHNPVSGAEQG